MLIMDHLPVTPPGDKEMAVALGFFDGVHLGHRSVLRSMAEYAGQNGLAPAVFTFKSGKCADKLIYSHGKKHALLASLKVAYCFEPDFSAFSHLSPEEFVGLLHQAYGARAVFCGWNFRFGKGRAGDAAALAMLCAQRGMHVQVLAPTTLDGGEVSSSYIRGLLAEGRMEEAGRFLGAPYSLLSEVRRGQGLGEKLGFPTINQKLEDYQLRPRYGVYATKTLLGGRAYPSVTGLGTRPTLGEGARGETCETFVPGFAGDLYGRVVEVEFYHYMAESRAFSGTEELAENVQKWALQARQYFIAQERMKT